ncbi:MAG TPA: hypothetical protein VKY59_11895 [Spirillospora sp.]|nr:hypothetical protein [Spirillospora sp.]
MNPDAFRAYFRMGVWVTLVALLLVIAVPRDAPEFFVSVCSLAVGLVLVTGTLVARHFLS